ncbi:hypothetical protein [Pseudoalteromonas sp. OOF1S-7]|nr:hypothetical protein [Pseudoalteromonas sp. OOF1S-7]
MEQNSLAIMVSLPSLVRNYFFLSACLSSTLTITARDHHDT